MKKFILLAITVAMFLSACAKSLDQHAIDSLKASEENNRYLEGEYKKQGNTLVAKYFREAADSDRRAAEKAESTCSLVDVVLAILLKEDSCTLKPQKTGAMGYPNNSFSWDAPKRAR